MTPALATAPIRAMTAPSTARIPGIPNNLRPGSEAAILTGGPEQPDEKQRACDGTDYDPSDRSPR